MRDPLLDSSAPLLDSAVHGNVGGGTCVPSLELAAIEFLCFHVSYVCPAGPRPRVWEWNQQHGSLADSHKARFDGLCVFRVMFRDVLCLVSDFFRLVCARLT